ncbi:MAG: DUF6599 family protein [Acidobacteriota bacterium]
MIILFWSNIMADKDLSALRKITGTLPEKISGWEKVSLEKYFSPENLFEYINGNAELFISYNFINMGTLSYSKDPSFKITIDIFDMGKPADAFGVFSHSRENEDNFINNNVGSEYGEGLLTFWKGQYYISILAYPDSGESKDVIKKIAEKITEQIPGTNIKPAIVSLLPGENLIPFSIRYFHHYIWLNSHYFISGENILNLGKDTEAVLAKYYLSGKNRSAAILLLVNYPSIKKAKKAYKNFLLSFIPGAKKGIIRLTNHRWTGSEQNGKIISIVLNAPDREHTRALLSKIKY